MVKSSTTTLFWTPLQVCVLLLCFRFPWVLYQRRPWHCGLERSRTSSSSSSGTGCSWFDNNTGPETKARQWVGRAVWHIIRTDLSSIVSTQGIRVKSNRIIEDPSPLLPSGKQHKRVKDSWKTHWTLHTLYQVCAYKYICHTHALPLIDCTAALSTKPQTLDSLFTTLYGNHVPCTF